MQTIKVDDIYKVFSTVPDEQGGPQDVVALDGITLNFSAGEIHTLLGENGAGKSTLVHILSGLQQQTGGSVFINNQAFRFESPFDALTAGIAMVHQNPYIARNISVLENIIAGSRGPFLRKKKREREIRKIAETWNIPVNLHASAGTLTPAGRLRTALLAALFRKPAFLILDEPSAVLSREEREDFFSALREAAARGLGIILITHRIEEALRWSDRISVLRQGRLIFSSPVRNSAGEIEITEEQLADMLGLRRPAEPENPAKLSYSASSQKGTELTVSGLSAKPHGRQHLADISFTVRPGGITGIVGLPGSGIETLEDVLSGMIRAGSGKIGLRRGPGEKNSISFDAGNITPAILRGHGISIVPSDRYFRATNPGLTIFETVTVYRSGKWNFPRREDRIFVQDILNEERIPASPERPLRSLSGGQIQRLVLARELKTGPEILILSRPEWGLDIRTTELLHEKLKQAADSGVSVLLLSGEPEASDGFSLFNEVYYMREGTIL
ncbi:ATP-binding cassette domain-containing protein [Brucepastera parasyntrophica]|uniref:ATP-binding cassette domain-containing protein n=1 Tax=Brucepastera parasyntrophica TaxID=2880008 RepID=UPI00210C8132|nr:ATP-binding cassette domain-containing protein [Brucepastera parasyntrophica]ULQ59079.1 ATP-binding cassette domain-containing protein [Brucepastera parasyntrophica]